MRKYILKRLLYSIITIWVIITATFFLMHLMPGNPLSRVGSRQLPEEVVANINAKYHLDKPLITQYLLYLKGIVTHFDLGQSLRENRTVNEVIASHFPNSALIGLEAVFVATVLGIILGIVAALKKNRAADYVISSITVLGISIPAYIIALILQYFLAYKLTTDCNIRLFPIDGWGTFRHTILPSIAVACPMIVSIIKFMRTNMLDVLNQDYIKTAKAKGVSQSIIIWRHTVRNAILPIITLLGPMLVSIIMGTVIIERIFSIPGLGGYFVNSIQNHDYTMIMGTTIFYSIFLVLTNFAVDLIYGLVDPRIRISK